MQSGIGSIMNIEENKKHGIIIFKLLITLQCRVTEIGIESRK